MQIITMSHGINEAFLGASVINQSTPISSRILHTGWFTASQHRIEEENAISNRFKSAVIRWPWIDLPHNKRQMNTNSITVQPNPHTPMPLEYYYETLGLTSRSNLWRWTKQGLRVVRVGGRVYITQADLQRFMNEMSGGVQK